MAQNTTILSRYASKVSLSLPEDVVLDIGFIVDPELGYEASLHQEALRTLKRIAEIKLKAGEEMITTAMIYEDKNKERLVATVNIDFTESKVTGTKVFDTEIKFYRHLSTNVKSFEINQTELDKE